MMESGREYVLQWPGYAAYVTERFSGLLARQALVDLTLICEEQRIRVHKLVLASCSLYFEAILETEDFGSDPIIVLKDLEFSILKAMIEFMYCGETTVSHVYLPSLLAAARLFKVKELETLVEKMVGCISPDHNDNETESPVKETTNPARINGMINNEESGIRVSFINKNNVQIEPEGVETDSETDHAHVEDNSTANLSDLDRCVYEDLPYTSPKSQDKINGEILKRRRKHQEPSIDSNGSSNLYSEQPSKNYEKCCDLMKNGCVTNDEDETGFNFNGVGKCTKTYVHKKRKKNCIDGPKRLTPLPQQILSSSSIDLLDEVSMDGTIKPNRNSECLEYDFKYDTENIMSIVGCKIEDSITLEILNKRTRSKIDNNKDVETEEDNRPPVLRRSVRLNQQESDEPSPPRLRSKLRDDKKTKPDLRLLSRTKRKNKDLDRRVPNEKAILHTTKKNPRRTSKLVVQKLSTKNHITRSDRDLVKNKNTTDQNKLTNSVSVANNSYKSDMAENHVNEPFKLNTIPSSVNRALWGDMTDANEDGTIDIEFMEYSKSAEIPFAVGLLPLRAALEKMQATPDHQPRKTRSSALLGKQDLNPLKRKNSPVPTKKSCTSDPEVEENPSAVYHVHIRTSPPDSRARKNSLSDETTNNLEQATGHS